MNPTYRKIPVDFLNKFEIDGKKQPMGKKPPTEDEKWQKQSKVNDRKRAKQLGYKNVKEMEAGLAKKEKEREEAEVVEDAKHTCPTCGHDEREDDRYD
jgi:hypothetical protein